MTIYSIYKVTNLVNGKVYIGFSEDYETRWANHKNYAFYSNLDCYNSKFYCAIRKYGVENFTWEVIYQSLDAEHTLKEMEPKFIEWHDSYANGYNMTLGGEGCFGYKHSPETLEKMRLANLGKTHKQETKDKLRLIKLGTKMSDEAKLKMRLSHIGKPGRPHTDEYKAKRSRDYIIINPAGEKLKVKNLTQFCKENNLDQGHMCKVAQGKLKACKGWVCLYAD